jgi:galactosyl transferase GMA12/MNN10 family
MVSLVPQPGERMTIAHPDRDRPAGVICSLATGGHRRLMAESAPTMQAYALRHGWDVVLSCEELTERPPSWAKVVLIRELLQTYDHVFWVDADAIIVDLERDVLAETSDSADAWFARHPQERDPNATVLNAGIILVRASDFAQALLGAMWDATQFVDHNWWENAALLDLLGYSLEPPYARLRSSDWDARIGELPLAWNSVPGYCEAEHPALNHHARSDHDNFDRRLAAMAADRRSVIARWPADFGYPADAGRRDHAFESIPFDGQPTMAEVLALVDRLDELNEVQRLKLADLYDLLEEAVTAQVNAERRLAVDVGNERVQREQAERELAALRATKLFRAASPLRRLYGKVRGR